MNDTLLSLLFSPLSLTLFLFLSLIYNSISRQERKTPLSYYVAILILGSPYDLSIVFF